MYTLTPDDIIGFIHGAIEPKLDNNLNLKEKD